MTMAISDAPQGEAARGNAGALAATFRAEELEGLRLSTRGRLVSLSVVAVLLLFVAPLPEVLFYHGTLFLFALIGLADFAVARSRFGRPAFRYLFIALDFVLMTYIFVVPNPLESLPAPPQMQLRTGNAVYFFMLLAGAAFSFSPRLMLWAGAAAGLCWSIGAGSILLRPETTSPPRRWPVLRKKPSSKRFRSSRHARSIGQARSHDRACLL